MLKNLLNSDLVLRVLEVIDRRSENRMTEFGMLAQAFEFAKINGISGDYFEFGVWRGKTFCYARKMARRYRYGPVKFFAFDSFKGLPAVANDRFEVWSTGQFTCSSNEFCRILHQNGFTPEEYELVPGFYGHSLNGELVARLQAQKVKASIIYIDCDLYESTVPVLDFILDFLQSGTILCFDDFYNYRGLPGYGEQRALTEFEARNSQVRLFPYMPYSPLGMSFITGLGSEIDATMAG